MPAALEKHHPHVDVRAARDQVRAAIKRAIQVIGGSQAEVAEKLTAELRKRHPQLSEISKEKLRYWAYEGTFIEREYCEAFEQASDMAVTRRHLRPDQYPNG